MSRIGKNPVEVPAGVEVTLNGREIKTKGAKGELTWLMPHEITASKEENTIVLTPKTESKRHFPMWGTSRAMVANMVKGVAEGYTIPLKLIGVGYRANTQGNILNLTVGYSHPVAMEIPAGLTVAVTENTNVVVSGASKQSVGQFAAEIRAKRPPEPFKGKGIRYADEYINMKEGKKS